MRRFSFTILASAALLAGAADARDVSIPERLMVDLQADFDLEDFQAAGIVGNLAKETMNFQVLQEINPLVKGSRGGFGYSQWTGPRRAAFESFAEGEDMTTYEVNYAFLSEELNGPYSRVIEGLRSTETLEEATGYFMRRYLAPSPRHADFDGRMEFASSFLEGNFSGSGCATIHITYQAGNMEMLGRCPTVPDASMRPRARPDNLQVPDAPEVQDDILLVSSIRPVPRPAPSEPRSIDDLVAMLLLEDIKVTDPFAVASISDDPSHDGI